MEALGATNLSFRPENPTLQTRQAAGCLAYWHCIESRRMRAMARRPKACCDQAEIDRGHGSSEVRRILHLMKVVFVDLSAMSVGWRRMRTYCRTVFCSFDPSASACGRRRRSVNRHSVKLKTSREEGHVGSDAQSCFHHCEYARSGRTKLRMQRGRRHCSHTSNRAKEKSASSAEVLVMCATPLIS